MCCSPTITTNSLSSQKKKSSSNRYTIVVTMFIRGHMTMIILNLQLGLKKKKELVNTFIS